MLLQVVFSNNDDDNNNNNSNNNLFVNVGSRIWYLISKVEIYLICLTKLVNSLACMNPKRYLPVSFFPVGTNTAFLVFPGYDRNKFHITREAVASGLTR